MKHERILVTREPVGAAVLQPEVTKALRRAALIELARTGYANLSMAAIARRAHVGKPALYRRWKGKQELVADLFQHVGLPIVEIDDLGSLENELAEYARRSMAVLRRPLAKAILPDIYAEMARDSELAHLIRSNLQEPKRVRAEAILERAIDRREVAATIDRALALDIMAGPLYWRTIVTRQDVGDNFALRYAKSVAAALQAC
jgi:AcrR family transcriptional regulator